MKKFMLVISILALAPAMASAADMSVKAVVPPAPLPSWAGFYIGGHGGYGWKDDPFSLNVDTLNGPLLVNGFKSKGWVGGGHFGYNWQYGSVVGGLELDVSATGIKGNSGLISDPGLGPNGAPRSAYFEDSVKLLASARGRLGWAPNSDWLFYGTGGLALERMEQSLTTTWLNQLVLLNNTNMLSAPGNFVGWVAGGGVEARLMGSNWIARVEYLHYDFGHTRSATVFSQPAAAGGFLVRTDTVGSQTIDVVRAGLSYKFGS
jgi:outer membrane immunogenic protein